MALQELKSTVQKTFAIIEHFTSERPEWGVTELAQEMGANKSTVYRFMADLSRLGVLYKHPITEKYSLGLKLFELGGRVNLKSAFIDKTHPELVEVSKSITETVHLAVLKNNQVFYVDKVESPQGLKLSSQIGSYNPAYATALGKVLLAYLPNGNKEQVLDFIFSKRNITSLTNNTITSSKNIKKELSKVKAQGYAIDKEELELGLICVAVPIFNLNNEVVASLSASGPANRFEESKVSNYVATLKKGAHAIQQKIGYFKP